MKKYILIFIMFICLMFGITPKSTAEELFKITSANFDVSSSIISLTSSSLTEIPEISDIKVVKLSNPTRLYFDLPGAVLQGPKKDWVFSTDGIKEVKVSQFSANPAIVRVVVNYDDNFDVSNMTFNTLKNGLFVKFKGNIAQNPYMQNTYRDDHSSSSDFYEYMTISTTPSDPAETIARIDNALNNAFQGNISQELKLNTRYYVDKITTANGIVTINGIGSAAIEKPMILTNPLRIVFDLPNTLVNRSIRNREISIGAGESVRIGQFSVNKARVVITTDNVTKYIPVYSRDNQTLVLTNTDYLNNLKISGANVSVTGVNNTKVDSLTNALTLNFNAPIVHGFDRTNSEVILYLLNVSNYNQETFNKAIIDTPLFQAKITKASRGLQLSIPIEHDSLVNTFLGMDGKSLKVQIKAPRDSSRMSIMHIDTPVIEVKPPINMPKGTDGKFRVVIDPGHGGSDAGAIRNGVYEKFITLDVAKRVEKMLKAQGYGVLMTRSDDSYVSLQDRVAFSEAYAPDIFVSIHVNSSTSDSPNGIETHYYHQESIPLAQTVHSSLISTIKANNRGTFKSKFYVINHTTSPAILIEIGFLSNYGERVQLLTEARKQATANAIVEGINNYFKSSK